MQLKLNNIKRHSNQFRHDSIHLIEKRIFGFGDLNQVKHDLNHHLHWHDGRCWFETIGCTPLMVSNLIVLDPSFGELV